MKYSIPVYQPSLRGNEKKYVMECLDSTWISSKGRFLVDFEREFARYIGVTHAAAVSNGTVALHLALVALGVGADCEVLVPTLTYIASVNAITYTRATPVFVDSRASDWQMDPEDVRRKITPKTRAIMAVHLYGHPCPMEELREIAREHNLFLIEDCAEAFGSLYKGQHVGTFSDIATFSFFGNKTITTGEGGMVVTNDQTLYERIVHFRGQGLAKHREYWHDAVGYNYRMTNICAALGLAQLERADELIESKLRVAEWYREYLRDLTVTMHASVGDVRHSYWMVSILTRLAGQRDALRATLSDAGIETRPLFYPVHSMPMYSQRFQQLPVAEDIAWRGINLPSWPDLCEQQVMKICEVVRGSYV